MRKKKTKVLWERQYRRRQRQINAYAHRQLCARQEQTFVIRHPDEQRCYLMEGPCPRCPLNGFCDKPCRQYIQWYDEKMALVRQLLGGEVLYGECI